MDEKLQKIIAAYTPFDYSQIKLDIEIKNHYIAAEMKDNFVNDICRAWPDVNSTELHNIMFTNLKTGREIVNYIGKIIVR
ncbi:MAG: hypothetical protein LWX07_00920 [Bacteroidetes bacterium]|nr:hypothetical protein [Bacteroidota bacterium]